MHKAINVCSFISLHQSCDGWWKNVKLVSDLFILILHRWQLTINPYITGNGVLQQTWLLFLTWLIIFGGRGAKNNVWSRSVSFIKYKDSYPVQTPQQDTVSVSGLLGIEFLVQKECIGLWLFFMAKVISELQCAYDQIDYLSIMYSFCANNTQKQSKPHEAYLTNVDSLLAPTMEW